MSQTQQFPISDAYLASPTGGMFNIPNDLTVDPEYGNIKFVTPIGRLSQLSLIKPSSFTQEDGSQSAPKFNAQILLNPNACIDLYRAIVAVATHRWPQGEVKADASLPRNPDGSFATRVYTAEEMLFIPEKHGGLHYPLREGSDSYMRDPVRYEAWRELYFVNASKHPADNNGNPTRPTYYDADGQLCDPSIFYRGCYGTLKITIYSYPKPGKQGRSRGVGIGLDGVRFVNHGERMGGYNAVKADGAAFARANIPKPAPVAPEVGYGSHAATPGSVPPGVAMPGFAAPPPPQQQAPAYQPQQAPAYQPQQQAAAPQPTYQPAPAQGYPPQQPQSGYAPAGARPPGG